MGTRTIAINAQITLKVRPRPKIARKKKANKQMQLATDKTVTISKWNYLQRLKQKSCLFGTRVLLKNANTRSRADFKQNKRNRVKKKNLVRGSPRSLI